MRLQVTKRTDYAIRACLCLAMADRCPISSRRIAEQMEIPDRFLPQVMADLIRAGIVGATNGKYGGYCLSRDPAAITILDLVESIEGAAGGRGPGPTGELAHAGPGDAFQPIFSMARAAFVDILAGASLADLVARQRVAQQSGGLVSPERTR